MDKSFFFILRDCWRFGKRCLFNECGILANNVRKRLDVIDDDDDDGDGDGAGVAGRWHVSSTVPGRIRRRVELLYPTHGCKLVKCIKSDDDDDGGDFKCDCRERIDWKAS